jgi:sulfite exporter TauE/SafE
VALSALIGAWLAGVLGGAHCLAMCGGFLAALSSAGAPSQPLVPARSLVWRQLPYNLGRVTTYGVLGAAVGAAGGASLLTVHALPLQRALFVTANLFLVALGVGIVWRREGAGAIQRAAAGVFTRLAPAVRALATRDAAGARFALGMIWGLVPCGLVYGVLPIALFAGSTLAGAAVMVAFGLGTLPNLVAAGWVVARARHWLQARRSADSGRLRRDRDLASTLWADVDGTGSVLPRAVTPRPGGDRACASA